MPLALEVDTLDNVPEALKSEYEDKGDGKFRLKIDGLPDIDGLRKHNKTLSDENAARRHAVAAWEKLGKSPDEINTMLETERKKAEDAALKAGKFDEVLAQHLGNAKKERDTAVGVAEKKAEAALGIARKAVVGSSLSTALTKAKATAEGMAALPKLISDRVDLKFDDDGKESISILNADGTPMVGSGKDGLATFDDLVKDAIKQFPSLFEGTGGGSGTDPRGQRRDAGGKTLTRKDFESLGPTERASKIREGFKVID